MIRHVAAIVVLLVGAGLLVGALSGAFIVGLFERVVLP